MEFSEIRDDFEARVRRIVWATVTTVDTKGRPRSRILHPYWEGTTAWVLTGRQTLKTKHLALNPHVAICYWDPKHEQVYAEGVAEWADDQADTMGEILTERGFRDLRWVRDLAGRRRVTVGRRGSGYV